MAAATATNTELSSQAVLVTSDIMREFLNANEVTANGTSTDAKAAVVRVICVRKSLRAISRSGRDAAVNPHLEELARLRCIRAHGTRSRKGRLKRP